ncbi:MAG: hypothetical protein AAGA58_17395 [Verrucomicrobiota bacterium]
MRIANDGNAELAESVAAALCGIRLSACESLGEGNGCFLKASMVLEARLLAANGDVKALVELDERLNDDAAFRSSEIESAGRELMEQLASAKHARVARQVLEAGGASLPVAFGIRCAAFDVVPLVSAVAYGVLLRMLSTGDFKGIGSLETLENLLDNVPQILTTARKAMESMNDAQPKFRCA